MWRMFGALALLGLGGLSGTPLHTFAGHEGLVNGVAFRPDGRHLATAGRLSRLAGYGGRPQVLKLAYL